MENLIFASRVIVWSCGAIILLAGGLMGVYRIVKPLWGYHHDLLFGVYHQGTEFVRSSGMFPLSIIRMGVLSIGLYLVFTLSNAKPAALTLFSALIILAIFALIQWFAAPRLEKLLPLHRLSGILGGLIGGVSGAIICPLFVIVIGTQFFPSSANGGVMNIALLSGLVGILAGAILAGKLVDGEFGGTQLGETCEALGQELSVWFVLFGLSGGLCLAVTPFASGIKRNLTNGLLVILAVGIVGTIYGTFVILLVILTRLLSWGIEVLLKPEMVRFKFSKIICQTCLRYTLPLDARYDLGVRYCEHCHQAVEATRIAGQVIVTFGNVPAPSGERLFILTDPDFETKDQPIDVAEIHLDPETTNPRLFERFITYLLNYPPKDGVESVQIIAASGLEAFGENLKNVVRNTFPRYRTI